MEIPIIPNTWHTEFISWFEQLQKKRREDYLERENSNTFYNSKDSIHRSELYYRNWGHINFAFADYFFKLLGELKEENTLLYNKYAHKANVWLFYYYFDKDIEIKEYMETYTMNKHKL